MSCLTINFAIYGSCHPINLTIFLNFHMIFLWTISQSYWICASCDFIWGSFRTYSFIFLYGILYEKNTVIIVSMQAVCYFFSNNCFSFFLFMHFVDMYFILPSYCFIIYVQLHTLGCLSELILLCLFACNWLIIGNGFGCIIFSSYIRLTTVANTYDCWKLLAQYIFVAANR